MRVYGFIDHSGSFVEVGNTEVGAKIAARRGGYHLTEVGYRSEINNMFICTAVLLDGKWFNK